MGALQVLADHGSAVCREDEFGVFKVALQPAAMNFVSSVVCPAASTPLLKLPCSDVFAHHTHKLDLVLDLHRKDWTAEYDAPHYTIDGPSHIWLAWWPAANYTSHVCMPFSSFTTEASCKCWLPCQRTTTSVCSTSQLPSDCWNMQKTRRFFEQKSIVHPPQLFCLLRCLLASPLNLPAYCID